MAHSVMLPPNVPLLLENEEIFALNKPSGLHSVMLKRERHSKECAPSLAAMLLELNPWLKSVSKKPEDAGLIQRLDYWTSGVIIGAKSRQTWERLFALLQKGEIKKSYLALVEGNFPARRRVQTLIGNVRKGSPTVKVREIKGDSYPKGYLPATTSFKLIRYSQKHNLSLLEVIAPTARRHQIRAHAAYLGFPLCGDMQYGAKHELPNGRPGFYLHAQFIELPNEPVNWKSQQKTRIAAPVEAYLKNLKLLSGPSPQ